MKMAFSISGILGRLCRPTLQLLNLHGAEIIQTRDYAARKGTREKALKKKRAMKLKKAAQPPKVDTKILKSKQIELEPTIDQKKINPPTEYDVFLAEEYRHKEYTITEAVQFHRENLHPSVLNNPKSNLKILIELNMVAEKKTKFLNKWKNIVCLPHLFSDSVKKKILVLCHNDHINKMLENGADLVGGSDLIKEIKVGDVNVSLYDQVIGQVDLIEEISTIRSKLKQLFPKASNGTLTKSMDLLSSLQRFKYGLEYSCIRSESDKSFGWIDINIGTIDMDTEKLEENFITIMKDINSMRPKREGDFITWIWCSSPPSKERFRIGVQYYLEKLNTTTQGDTLKNGHTSTTAVEAAAVAA